VIVDIATTREEAARRPANTHDDPVFILDGIVHYLLGNSLARPQNSHRRAANTTLPYGLMIAERGWKNVRFNEGLAKGVNIYSGTCPTERGGQSGMAQYTPVQEPCPIRCPCAQPSDRRRASFAE
jgi:alanine dehydrogenase